VTQPTYEELVAATQDYENRVRSAQQSLDMALVTGRSADGTVTVLANGLGKLKAVQVNPSIYDDRDVTALQNAIAQAIGAAGVNASRLAQEKMGPVEINLY